MKNQKNVRFLISASALALAVLAASGCATAGNQSLKKETEQSVAAKITEGKTTFTDGGSEVWSYELAKMSADGITYVPIVGLFAGSSSGTKKELGHVRPQRGGKALLDERIADLGEDRPGQLIFTQPRTLKSSGLFCARFNFTPAWGCPLH